MTISSTPGPGYDALNALTSGAAEAPLTPDWAFVIQLRQGTAFTADHLCGRIEHVVSGRACLFGSLERARSFMELVMCNASPDPFVPFQS